MPVFTKAPWTKAKPSTERFRGTSEHSGPTPSPLLRRPKTLRPWKSTRSRRRLSATSWLSDST